MVLQGGGGGGRNFVLKMKDGELCCYAIDRRISFFKRSSLLPSYGYLLVYLHLLDERFHLAKISPASLVFAKRKSCSEVKILKHASLKTC